MKQSTRIQIAKDTLSILEKGYYRNKSGVRVDIAQSQTKSEQNTRLYKPEELDELTKDVALTNKHNTAYEVTNETTLDAVRRLIADGENSTLCLNFASAKNPGGGFLGGALAQEECITRATGLYPCLLSAKEYYVFHRKQGTCLYSDHMIYSPGVPILKNEDGEVLDELTLTTIITSPAVNAGVVKRNEQSRIKEIMPVMQKRIEKLLSLCVHHKYDTIVLGAWGCGVFQNDPEDIAELFYQELSNKFSSHFKRVVFAVYTKNDKMIDAFSKRFINNKQLK